MADQITIFADGVLEVSVRHGVARVALAVQDGKGAAVPSGLLVLPLAQVPSVAGALTRLMREVETRAREAQAAGAAAAPEAAEPLPAETFRFQG